MPPHPSPTDERLSETIRVKRMLGRVLTGNGITRYSQRDALLQLCRQRLDALHRHSLRR